MQKEPSALCVVPCGKAKVWDREPTRLAVEARHVYTGSFASAALAYAEHFYESWVILSAKHGLLMPTDLVPGPYDATFARKRDPALVSAEELRAQVRSKGLDRFSEIVVVAGKDYVAPTRASFPAGIRVVVPLAGMTSMGAMIGALRRAVKDERPLVAEQR